MDAEDALQTVFIRLLQAGKLPNPDGNAGGYLYRSVVNAALDLVRARNARPQIALEGALTFTEPRRAEDPESLYTSRELRQWLRRAVAGLSPRSAEIFALRFFEGYQNHEIAEMLEASPATVAVILHRARLRLQEEIEEHLGGRK